MGLNSRSRFVSMIIDDKISPFQKLDGVPLEHVVTWLKENSDFYAYVYHDMDTKIDNFGSLIHKHSHTHFVFLLKENEVSKKTGKPQFKRLSTIMNEVSDLCGFDTDRFTMSVASDWVGNCRYLMHLDDKDKFPYERECVITSDVQKYNTWIEKQSDVLTTETLYKLLEECNFSLYKVMSALGLERYRRYRLVISDICKSRFKTFDA